MSDLDELCKIEPVIDPVPDVSSGDGIIRTNEQMKAWALQDRILLQACLGSDLRREMISWKRAQDGEKNVVVFFEKKKEEK